MIGRATLAVCRAAYECWVSQADEDLTVYLDAALRAMASGFTPAGAAVPSRRRAAPAKAGREREPVAGRRLVRCRDGSCTDWDVARLVAAKAGQRISVVIPARNEAPTIGGIVAAIRRALISDAPLVDEVVVIDSDSTDDTAEIAAAAGALVQPAESIRPELGHHPGKGEALWKSLFVTPGDLLVFIDADLTEWGPHFVTGLLGPLLTTPTCLGEGVLRPAARRRLGTAEPAGRARHRAGRGPLLSLCWPALTDVVQPLAGEWAIRRKTFATLPVPIGYGVEMSTLLDVHAITGWRRSRRWTSALAATRTSRCTTWR